MNANSMISSLQHNDVFAFVNSFAEYVPAPCTHRPSSHPSEALVKLAKSDLNQDFARRAKS
jgi:hypothetical protein